uniref:Beta-lactamase domain-containing protein n=1 Tax=Ascaris lumbricoides TaxID=6252 RepID=A0A0M3I5T1_ASCLU
MKAVYNYRTMNGIATAQPSLVPTLQAPTPSIKHVLAHMALQQSEFFCRNRTTRKMQMANTVTLPICCYIQPLPSPPGGRNCGDVRLR